MQNSTERRFIEVGSFQAKKHGMAVCGDTFLSRAVREERRLVCTLSDGLGSGVKARVLSGLTAAMALRYAVEHIDLCKAAGIIMQTLPVCAERRISYSTFTIADVQEDGAVGIVEYDNPPFLWLQGAESGPCETTTITLAGGQNRDAVLHSSVFTPALGDRIVFFTDGVTQAGMGRRTTPFGWGYEAACAHVRACVAENPEIAADDLARSVVQQAGRCDGLRPGDDTSCCVICIRRPRRLLIVTGPPFDETRDAELARRVAEFPGRVIISGGTTAQIVSRQLARDIAVDLSSRHPDQPPAARMEGTVIVSEGTITVSRVAKLLEEGFTPDTSPAGVIATHMLASDIVEFLVGTRINQAHQNPLLPVELDIRRNIVRRIAETLEKKYCKETTVTYL